MSLKPARGTAMRVHRVHVRFVPLDQSSGAPRKLSTDDLPELRRLLRSDLSINEIAEKFDISGNTLRNFIRQRRLCNIRDRQRIITAKRQIAAAEVAICVTSE